MYHKFAMSSEEGRAMAMGNTHTHTHTQLFTALCPGLPGEPVSEETFTDSHLS